MYVCSVYVDSGSHAKDAPPPLITTAPSRTNNEFPPLDFVTTALKKMVEEDNEIGEFFTHLPSLSRNNLNSESEKKKYSSREWWVVQLIIWFLHHFRIIRVGVFVDYIFECSNLLI